MKKRILALVLVLVLSVVMAIPSFATGDLTGGDVFEAYRYVNSFAGQSLNAFTTKGYGEDYSNINVTTWATDPNDMWQRWLKLYYSDGSYRLGCSPNYWYQLEYYYGRDNPSNAQLYRYDPAMNNETLAADVALGREPVGDNSCMYYLIYHSGKYLAAQHTTLTYGGQGYHNVFWATTSQASAAYRTWNEIRL